MEKNKKIASVELVKPIEESASTTEFLMLTL